MTGKGQLKSFATPLRFGLVLTLELFCSCATGHAPNAGLPSDVVFNEDGGRGNVVIVAVRLADGEKLPLMVETGSWHTLLDKSLEPKLGKRLGETTLTHFGAEERAGVYVAPRLYLGKTQLLTGSNVATFNFKAIAAQTGHGVMGVLGMDVLRHYCIQLDFTADRMRFLDDEHADKKNWGKAFPLHKTYWMPLVDENLVGVKGTGSLVDTGFNGDGWLTPKLHRQWTNHAQSPTNGEARSPDGVLGGEVYSYVDLDEISEQAVPKTETNTPLNGIGLEILAQNIVTFDFPKDVMYFKRTSEIPLPPKALQAAINSMGKTGFDFLHRLSEKGRLPGFSKSEHWSVKATFRIYPPTSETVDVLKKGDSAIYHYELIRASEKGPWRLQKAWRIDRDGRNFEYPVP